MPQLLGNFEKKRTVTTLKRAYSDLHNYVKAFNYENDCDNNFANCAPANGEFVYKFARFLQDKQNFRDDSIPKINNWFYIKNLSQGKCDIVYTKSPITEENTNRQYYLMFPSGKYAYIITLYMHDNDYRVNGIKNDVYRARIFIITDPKSVKHTSNGCNASKAQYGKNVFEAYITQFNHIIPNGSPICTGWQYYCKPLEENDCTKESGNYTRCLQKIIEDGWEIKYNY